MSKTPIRPSSPWPGKSHEKWKTCRLCSVRYKTCELKFDSGGTTEPTVGETFTGNTSGDTGVVTDVQSPLISGTWAGGDAVGFITLDTLTGDDGEQLTMFQDNETITGSTTGSNVLTCNGEGQIHIGGVFYPKRLMGKYEGVWYCHWHYGFRARPKERDREKLRIREDERGKE